tara:strand:+ start:335 stop:667 length:333 start_codon:yes stop_codon:yes gene_type:complete
MEKPTQRDIIIMERTLAAQHVLTSKEFTVRDLIDAAGLNCRIGHEDRQFIGRKLGNQYRTGTKRKNGDSYSLSLYHKCMNTNTEVEFSETIYRFFEIVEYINRSGTYYIH